MRRCENISRVCASNDQSSNVLCIDNAMLTQITNIGGELISPLNVDKYMPKPDKAHITH